MPQFRKRSAPGALKERLRQWASRPETFTDVLQISKTVVAATAAWALSIYVLGSQMPFLAPWTALLTVHATVYRSFAHGAQTTVSSAVGVGLSFVVGHFLGVSLWTFALALLVGVVISRFRWVRDEGAAIATTAIFILGNDYSQQESLLGERVLEVGLGVALGVAVNMLVLPPVRDQQASRYVDSINRRMGAVLLNMAHEFDESWDTDQAESWLKETNSMTAELGSAWSVVRFARESKVANPRFGMRVQKAQRRRATREDQVSYEEILGRIDEGISHLRNLTRTLREASYVQGGWDARFREQWVEVVRGVGEAIADPDAEVEQYYDHLDELASELSDADSLPDSAWPLYGALLTSVRHIVIVVDDVGSAREAREASEKTDP
ncbi:MAG: FUSC family protein [Nesterenkonia sp.]|uniref:Uncharacterized membrane protein YgaE (UPF0421/DUF939 family) n=1 Tax=Garicola koreensis TaxID=1262554 RepID=A0A7W5TP21_9MICC|nr:uncharacterized membrane protein YgaE (UPF0421/DUF939 family) [Garicola koreensis]